MSNDAQQPQEGNVPQDAEATQEAQPAPHNTNSRRDFLRIAAAGGLAAALNSVLPKQAGAEPIRSGGTSEKVEGQYRDRPIVSAMQYTPHPTDASQPGGVKEVQGRLVGVIDDATLSEKQLANIKAQTPPFKNMVAVYIDVDPKTNGDEIVAWMYEDKVKEEEKCMCKSRQCCGVRCGDVYVGTYTPEFTRQPQFTLIQDIDINVQVEQTVQQPWFPEYCTCADGRTHRINGYMGCGNRYPGLYAYNCPVSHQRRYFCHNNQASRYRSLFGGGSFSSFGR